ncbi:CXXC motif containing zinc binding protein, partial [Mycobacterium kansasii]
MNYKLMITAEMENIASLQPINGLNDPNFTYYFKLRCENCGEATEKETCCSLDEQVAIPKSRGVANLVQKCKFCGREGNITMVP